MQQPRPTHGNGQGLHAKSHKLHPSARHRARNTEGGAGETFVQKSAKSRDLILASAARLFRRQGYSATTLRQIAGAAKIEAGSIYYYFDSKEAILDESVKAAVTGAGKAPHQPVFVTIEVFDRGLRHVFDRA